MGKNSYYRECLKFAQTLFQMIGRKDEWITNSQKLA